MDVGLQDPAQPQVELPDEDNEEGRDLVGKLELCLSGIQDAARCWQDLLAGHLEILYGFLGRSEGFHE